MRSDYDECCDGWDLIRWRGAVASAIRGKRGQALLRELAQALDAMPVHELIANEFAADGRYCALGVLGAQRGIDVAKLDTDDHEHIARIFGISDALVREIMFVNDDYGTTCWTINAPDNPQKRWELMRKWVGEQIKEQT